MNLRDLISNISNSTGLPKRAVGDVIKAIADEAYASVRSGGELTLPGIGKVGIKARAARIGRNPKTGEQLQIPARCIPTFSAAKALKDACNV